MAEAGTIDSLQIEIEASSKSAVTQINNLAKALKNLKTATSGGLNIGNFKKELGKLGNNEYTKIEKLANALQGLKNIKLDDKIGNNMVKIADACDLIEQQHIDKLSKFGNALQTIKSVSTKGYDKLPASILNIAAAVDSITDDSIARLSRLTIALSRLRGVDLRGLGAVLSAQNRANKANRQTGGKVVNSPAISGQSDAGGGTAQGSYVISQFAGGFKNEILTRIKKAADATSAGSRTAESILHNLSNDFKNVASAAISAAKAIGGKFLSAIKSVASAAIGFGKNILVTPFQALASRVKKLTERMHNLVSSFKRVLFYRAVRTIIKELGDAMREGEENAYWYSKTIGDATHYISEAYDTFASASAMMKNQVGAAWATLFANIEPIIAKIVEMVSRAAEVVTMFFAKLGGKNTYLKAINYGKEWAETTEQGSEAAKEWRNQLMGFDEINRLEAPTDSNSGKNKDKTPDYGAMFEEVEVDSTIGDLAERLKELWNNQDWKGLGELIGNTLNDLFPSRDKWKEWGSYLGNGIDGLIQTAYYALKTIDFHEWGSRMADGLNSAIDEIDFDIAGRLLVRKFTALLDFVGGFLSGLDYHDLGKAIGDYFRGALDEASEWLGSYEWGTVSAELWQKLKTMIDGFDISSFASSLGNFIVTAANAAADFLNGLDFGDVVTTVIDSIKTFFDNLHTDEIKAAIGNLWEAIKTAFKDTMTTFGEWLHSKNEDGAFAQAGKDFNEGIQGFLADLKELSGYVPWNELGTAIGDFMKEIEWKEIFLGAWESVKPHFQAAADWFFGEESGYLGEKVIGLKLAFDMAGPVLGGAAQAFVFRMLTPLGTLAPGVGAAGAAANTSLSESLSPLAGTVSAKLSAVTAALVTGLTNFTVGGTTLLTGTAAYFAHAALAVGDALLLMYDYKKLKEAADTYNDTQEAINNQVDTTLAKFKKIYETKGPEVAAEYARMVADIDTTGLTLEEGQRLIKEKLESEYDDVPKNMWEGFKAGWNDYFGQDGKGLWQLVKDGFSGMIKGIKDFLGIHSPSTVMEEIGKNTIDGFKNGIETKWDEIKSFFSTSLDNIKTTVIESWDSLKDTAETSWENIKSVIGQKWDDTKSAAGTAWEGVSTTVSTVWDSLKSTAGTVWDGIKGTVTGSTDDITTESTSDTQTLYNDVTGIYNDIHSEAVRIFTDIARNVPIIMNHLAQEVENSVQQIFNAMQQMGNDIQNAISNIESLDWSIPAPHIPHITWYYETVYSDDGSSFNIPQFNVDWYAKGGVLDKATLFGMGEAGAEALVPLERNTEWIGKVAAEMNRQSSKQSEGRDESNDDVIDALYTICDRIIRAMPDGGDDIDMESLARSISKIQRRQARAMG